MKPHIIQIYGLYNPVTSDCFYVGRTKQSLKTRLTAHINSIMGNNNPKKAYINNLMDSGIRPTIELLAKQMVYSRQEIIDLETLWIDFVGLTHELTNIKKGESGCFDGDREIKLTEDQISRIGTASDASLARDWGVSQTTVSNIRGFRGIPIFSKWTATEETLLGTDYDNVISTKINKTTTEVKNRRTKLGIPPYDGKAIKWDESELALLGTISDRELARIKGCSYACVRKKRFNSEIDPLTKNTNWNPYEISLLGTIPDMSVAKIIGRSYHAVSNKRRTLGIPLNVN